MAMLVFRPVERLQSLGRRSLTARAAVLFCAALCFASFVWGMIRHFKRPPHPTPAMIRTALLGAVCAITQITSIAIREIRLVIPAIALYIGSLVLFWSAVLVSRGKLAACGQESVPSELLDSGPYRYVRHPFYLAYNLTWLAGFAATAWWPLAVAVMVMATIYEQSARREEAEFLRSELAAAYRQYRRRTGKYVPRLAVSNEPAQSDR